MQQQDHADNQAAQHVGEFDVGSDIQATPHGNSIEAEVKPAIGKAQDEPRNQVVGENSGVIGDSDTMTSGSSAGATPDDTAMRNLGRGTKHGHSADEPSDLNTLSDDRSVEHDAG
jgi:hypothetical protein